MFAALLLLHNTGDRRLGLFHQQQSTQVETMEGESQAATSEEVERKPTRPITFDGFAELLPNRLSFF